MFLKKELLTTSSESQRNKVLDILSKNNMKYKVKTKDNFGGGLYSDRRFSGSLGMDISHRFIYYIYVSRKDYSNAKLLIQQKKGL